MRILVIEDEYEIRSMLKAALEKYGKCDVAVTGIEALEMFKSALDEDIPYSLLCLDLMLPHTDGEVALKEIRKYEKKKGIKGEAGVKVIIISGVIEPAVVDDALRNWGANAYITKPFVLKHVLEEMRRLNLIKS